MSKPIKRITADTPIGEAEIVQLSQLPTRASRLKNPLFYMSSHSLARKHGGVSAARHNASTQVGRWLTKEDVVVRLDGDTRNIKPDNLEVYIRTSIKKVNTDTPVEEAEIIQYPHPRVFLTSRGIPTSICHLIPWLTTGAMSQQLDTTPQLKQTID